MPSKFDALAIDESSSSSSSNDAESARTFQYHEDLSIQRTDEETVLDAVYGKDYYKKEGVWGLPVLCVKVLPPDVEEERIGSRVTLEVSIGKKYPYVPPSIKFKDIEGLNPTEQKELMLKLKQLCISLAESGLVMVCEIVQSTEDFLLSHNKDPTNEISAWDQMQAKEEEKRKLALEEERKLDFSMMYEKESSSNKLFGDDSGHILDDTEQERIQIEYERQVQASKAAEQRQRNRMLSIDIDDESHFSSDDEVDTDDDDDVDEDGNKFSASRYKKDFKEEELLGQGGGGEVVKVRNKLDKRIYAVKKVVLLPERGCFEKKYKAENEKLKREVITISKLTHKNIVRYYQAWIEGEEEPESNADSTILEQSVDKAAAASICEEISESHGEVDSSGSSSSSSSYSRSLSEYSDDNDDAIDTAQLSDSDADFFDYPFSPLLNGFGFKNEYKKPIIESRDESIDTDTENRTDGGSKWTMYIQMEFCSTTLRHHIDDRVLEKMEKDKTYKMIRQILEALQYMHKRKVIHRDLKPGNIFLDKEGNVRLGDFGLAREKGDKFIDVEKSEIIGEDNAEPHQISITGGIGTAYYMAPEQANRSRSTLKGRRAYDTKADIFSLGIVIFEMFHQPFSTQMHRAQTLEKLRGDSLQRNNHQSESSEGNILESDLWREQVRIRFPDSFQDVKQCPENIQKVILWCLEWSPDRRPSVDELLRSELIPESENLSAMLQALFHRQATSISNEIDITWDTDAATKVRGQYPIGGKRCLRALLLNHLHEIGGTSFRDMYRLQSHAMNGVAMKAAEESLKRARNVGKIRGALHHAPQQTAAILAMSAATTAACTGQVLGAEPRVVDSICNQLIKVFQSHGAVKISPPLLRPKCRLEKGREGYAEVMNERGIQLLLPEDLTVNFARSLGRTGGIGVKRYDIDRVYHKSKAGGHPRENLDASFDIALEGAQPKGHIFEAEVIMVVRQIMRNVRCHLPVDDLLSSNKTSLYDSNASWFLRLTNTRLADAILDICQVPSRETTRRACLNIFTKCSATPLSLVVSHVKKEKQYCDTSDHETNLEKLLQTAMQDEGLPEEACLRLRTFLRNGCLPLPSDISSAIQSIEYATKKIRALDNTKKTRRYVDIARGIKGLENLVATIKTLGISLNMSLDLGLRQGKKKCFHGLLYFQVIMLTEKGEQELDKNITNDEILTRIPKLAIKVAEGGRYEDLVRKFRPPGNLALAQVDQYTSAPIPMCVGVRISVDRLVEQAYAEASTLARIESDKVKNGSPSSELESVRRSLGHPSSMFSGVQCIVVGMNGFDSETLSTRAAVASYLWSEGISAEYVPQSGVMMSLLQQNIAQNSNFVSDRSNWKFDQIEGICRLLKIPFLIIVQDHLLREKGVRLRTVVDAYPNFASSEDFVILTLLPSVIKDLLHKKDYNFDTIDVKMANERSVNPSNFNSDHYPKNYNQGAGAKGSHNNLDIECIYVDFDQFYITEKQPGRESKMKSVKKIIRSTTQRASSYFNDFFTASTLGDGGTVLAVDLPFQTLREFNSAAMFGKEGNSIVSSVSDFISNDSKHRKVLKTLAICLDHLIRRQADVSGSTISNNNGKSSSNSLSSMSSRSSSHRKLLSVYMYSIQDDRFDLLTLNQVRSHDSNGHNDGGSSTSQSKSRREKSGRR